MKTNIVYQETCLETLKKMPNEFLDCVITSPPYWQLRDYGHKDQWGLEPTFNDYLENLWSMMDEIYRVLKPSGTVWINLGDTYNTISGGVRGLERAKKENRKQSISKKNIIGQGFQQQKSKEIKNKCLLLIPHRFAIGCIDRGWIVRNDVIWAKRNGMPESVIDRFSKKHEYFFFMTKSEKYFFDLDAIKDKTITFDNQIRDRDTTKLNNTPGRSKMGGLKENNYSTKNPGSVSDFWDIPTKPSSNEHYASYNDALLRKPILAGCPENGLVYDPFMGTGSTAEVAIRANRNFIGSEINSDYIEICNKRLKPFLESYKLEF
ncbi:MAG: site-specific DNA-methyltransferase [Flavobacteriaceae bacterium]